MESRIRHAGVRDARGIARVHAASWQASYDGLLPDRYLRSLTVPRLTRLWRRRLHSLSGPQRKRDPGRQGFGRRLWVAAVDGTVIGFCFAHGHRESRELSGWVGEVSYLYVHPALLAQGVGTHLLERALGTLESHGYRWVVVSVLEANLRAREFYERRGLRFDGDRRQDRRFRVPVIRYAKALNPVVDWDGLALAASSRRPSCSIR